jgi:tRNA U34 5-methylaminomethyl-2-thiouridine-forming methyltransferase MnmC
MEETGESYHSTGGALSESMHIFISHGLMRILDNEKLHCSGIKIFEAGYGTGLNALLTLLYSVKNPDIEFTYTGVEKFPLSAEENNLLNYPEVIADAVIAGFESAADIRNLSDRLSHAAWNTTVKITDNFSINKVEGDLADFVSDKKYNLFYFDAFSPANQPELWSRTIFSKIASFSEPGALLVTYSAKGEVKEALRACGFEVKRFKGINGKRHNLSAVLPFNEQPPL